MITQLFPTNTSLKRTEFSTVPLIIHPLATRLYVEMGGEQYNITDIIDRAKADYRTTHKVGVQSCKVYVKPEEGAAYYVINKFSGKLEL